VEVPEYLKALENQFEFLERLGEGGMGEVWRVRNPLFDAEHALKVINPRLAHDRILIERLLREVRAMDKLRHPHAVAIRYASVRDVAFIEMEYVRGKTLDRVLMPGVPMSLEWTAEFLDQLCSVLQAAHDKQIVHRDLKPQNLMLVDPDLPGDLNLKVLDFGIAKFLDAGPNMFKTMDGYSPKTLKYMSPEQAEADGKLDARSDLFAVGLILYEILTGYHPFFIEGASWSHMSAIVAIVSKPAPPFCERNPKAVVPPEIEAVVRRCLEKNPDDRFASASELAATFRRLVHPEQVKPPPPPPPPPPRPWFVGLVTGLVLILLGAGIGGWMFSGMSPSTPPEKVSAVPPSLSITAGEEETLSLLVPAAQVAAGVKVEPPPASGLPAGLRLVRVPSAAAEGGTQRYRVETGPNFVRGPEPVRLTLSFPVSGGRGAKPVDVALEVRPPKIIPLPPGWAELRDAGDLEPIEGQAWTDRVKIGDRVCPRAIERRIDGVEHPAIALLIEKQAHNQPDPFYILRDKVWVELFAAYVREHPGGVPQDLWRPRPRVAGETARLPVMNVTEVQAEAFAGWLGGEGRGFVPTPEQWDQAAGRNRKNPRPGPYKEPWDPNDPSQKIAVNVVDGPLPVGAANWDISPSGCRDMSGNGWEWVRPRPNERMVKFRGQTFASSTGPLRFAEILQFPEAGEIDEPDDQCGFRIVIELDPGG
jgi:serine/threonine-protein kinase